MGLRDRVDFRHGLVALGWLLASCGASASVEPPQDTLRAYVTALRANDASRAYRLLDDETRAEVTQAQFQTLMTENREELLARATDLERLAARTHARAIVPLESGATVQLVLEEEGWRIQGGVLDAPVLRTPVDAVVAFRQALERRSFRSLSRVLARQTRNELEAEVMRLLEDTADRLDLDVERRGNQARVRTTSGREIELVREAGEWRVVEVR